MINYKILKSIVFKIKEKSKEPHTKVGALILNPVSLEGYYGYNGFVRGMNDFDDSKWERPIKYKYSEHAERNALYNCARMGFPTEKCILITTKFPCADCSRAIVQSGIKTLITPFDIHERWEEELIPAKTILEVGKIELIDLNSL